MERENTGTNDPVRESHANRNKTTGRSDDRLVVAVVVLVASLLSLPCDCSSVV